MKKILVFTGYYLPGYKAGGPIRTVANMVELLSNEFDFYIVTGDRDFEDTKPYALIDKNKAWQDVGKAKVCYLAPSELGFKNIQRIINTTPHDVLYLNSFFSFNYTIKPLLLRRLGLLKSKQIVLAPRGEFSAGALELKSKKKKVFIDLAKLLGLYKEVQWQASTVHESNDIQKVLSITDSKIVRAENLPDLSYLSVSSSFKPRQDTDPLRIVFLSRISPKKNIDYALSVLAKVNVPVVFDIYGVVDDAVYNEKLRKLIASLPKNIKARFKGTVKHSQVVETFSRYDLFLFPTKGENFGHAILESLSAGTPALLADTTPWLDLEGKGVGWALPLSNSQAFVDKIELMAKLEPEQQLQQRAQVREYAKSHLLNKENIEANKQLFIF